MRKRHLTKRLTLLVLISHIGFLTAAQADVWEFRRDGSAAMHRMPDYLQRANLREKWRPLSPRALGEKRAEYDPMIEDLANNYEVDTGLVHAIIQVESAYDSLAVSKTGAMGLMQLMPATAERFGVRDPLDPAENVDAGIRYLRELADEFADLELVLAAYNAGEKAVRRYGNRIPPFQETQSYIERVLAVLDRERPDTSK